MKGEKQNMNKFLQKVAKIFLGLSMAAGVGVAVSAGRKDARPVRGASSSITYTLNGNWTSTAGNWTKVAGNNLSSSLASGKYGLNSGSSTAVSPISYSSISEIVFTGSKSGSGSGTVEFLYCATSGGTYTSLGSKAVANSQTWTISTPVTGYLKCIFTRTAGNVYIASMKVTYDADGGGDTPVPSSGTIAGSATTTLGSSTGQWGAGTAATSSEDDCGQTWTVSYAPSGRYTHADGNVQFGSSSYACTSLSFVTSAFTKAMNLTAFTVKYGGSGNGAQSTATLKVGSTSLKTGSGISGGSTETLEWTGSQAVASGGTLNISFSGFAKGTKVYYISYTIANPKTLSSISVSGYTTSFTVGDAFSFGGTVTANYSDSTSANVTASATFSGYNMSAAGNYTVTASYTEGGTTKTATYSITVSAPPVTPAISVSPSSVTGYTGQSYSVTATFANLTSAFLWGTPSSEDDGAITGSATSSTGTATDGTSTYSGKLSAEGHVSLTTSGGGVANAPTVTFNITQTAFTTSPDATKSVAEGKTTTLTAALNSGGTINWLSDDTDVATVTSTGTSVTVTGVEEGTTTITARSADDSSVYAECEVTVTAAPGEIGISYSSYSENVPASGYAAMDWSADGISGKIYSIKNTDSRIQFQANTSYIYNTLAISGYITSISITKASGSYTQLTAYVADSDGGAISVQPESGGVNNNTDWTWSFDAEDHYCYFRIDATSSSAKYFSSITIGYQKVSTVDPTGIVLNDNSAISMDTYGYGRRRLSATVQPFNNNDPSITWGTSDSSVATISDGVLTAVGVGTTTVYATTGNFVSDVATPNLKASVSVTVTQALYEKATFVPTSSSAVSQADDYLAGGSVELSSSGSYNNDKNALQLSGGKSATFTISGYTGMKITGIDLVMSSNGNAGTGSMTVTAGETNIYEIETAGFDDSTWNGAYDALACDIYKDSTDYVMDDGETIVFSFSATANSLYIHSISIRYLDYKLEKWCGDFLNQITCDGSSSITDDSNWDDLGLEFLELSEDLRGIAATATANKDSDSVIEQAMARYDLILRKYGIGTGAGQHDDFIERFGVGKINGPLNPSRFLLNNIIGENTNTVAIIVIISMVSVTAIGGYFFLRKRKENI